MLYLVLLEKEVSQVASPESIFSGHFLLLSNLGLPSSSSSA